MKKETIKNMSLVALCLVAIGGISSFVFKSINKPCNEPSISVPAVNQKITPQVEFYEAETLYGLDYEKIIRSIPEDCKYTISYDCVSDNLLNQEKPSANGRDKVWTATVTIEEDEKYNSASYTKDFYYVGTSYITTYMYFVKSNDSWGGDSNGTSVNCSSDNVKDSNSDYHELTINKNNNTSACLDSKYEMFDGEFRIVFKTDLSDYGTFSFWLTGVEAGENTKDEVTFELLPNNKAIFGSAKSDDYKSVEKTLDKNYADGYWHELILNYNHVTPEASVTIDNEVIYEFESENLPTVPYVKPHIGLLYPTNPTWTGEKTEKINKAYVANYKAYKTDGTYQSPYIS